MPTYKAPTRDTKFVVNELLRLESYGNLPGFESASIDLLQDLNNNEYKKYKKEENIYEK